MVETLLETPANWLAGDGPEASIALSSQGALMRNLTGFPFAASSSEDDRHMIEERVLAVLDRLNLLATGRYCSLCDLDDREARFLVERQLIPINLLNDTGPRGVYISEDQSLSIVVNGDDHLCIQTLASGMKLRELWNRLNLMDDTLAGLLDYAYDDALGYLTSSVGNVGTGFRASVVLHLPALAMQGEISRLADSARESRHALRNLFEDEIEAGVAGVEETAPERISPFGLTGPNLYFLSNVSTLGASEEENVFHLRHVAGQIIDEEKRCREKILQDTPRRLEDRVGRATGIAQHARLLEFEEGLAVLSSLRLGVDTGCLPSIPLRKLNEVLMNSQNAHLEMKLGRECDSLTLISERAELFNLSFG
jgi:protein arginine kinase